MIYGISRPRHERVIQFVTMAMDALLPSEIARMVYGYLLEERCTEAARLFLQESSNLEECRKVLLVGRHFSTRVCGLTLLDVLEKFCLLNTIVQERLESFDKLDKLRHCSDLTSQIKILFEEYKSKNIIPTVNTATQSTPSLHGSPSKFRKRRIFSNREDDKTKKIAQEFTEESQDHSISDQSPLKSVEATPLKNLPGYTGEFEIEKHKKLNSKISEQNSLKCTPQKNTVSQNAHLQKVQKVQNIQLQEIQKDEILIRKKCPNFNKDINFQTENVRHIDSEVQTEMCSITVLDKNVMTETEQKTCTDTEVQTSDIGSPESEVQVAEILSNFTEKLINRTEAVDKIVENINTELQPIKSNLLENTNDAKEACSKSLIAEFNKAIEAAANKSENDPEIVELINAIVLPPEEYSIENKDQLDTQSGTSYSSSQEQINSVSEETVSESSIEKDVVISDNVNKNKVLENKDSDGSKNAAYPKNSENLEIDSSNQTAHQVDPRINNIFASSTDVKQVVSHNSQITVSKENNINHNTETLFNSLDSLHVQKQCTTNSDNIFVHNNTITSTPIKTFTAIENFDPNDWFSAQELPMSNVAYYKEEVTKCVTTTSSGIYTSSEAIITNPHFLSPIASKDTNKTVEKINCTLTNTIKDQTLHTPDILFPPKINTAVTVNSDSCPMSSAQKNKTPTLQKTSEILDQVLDIQSAQKSDKNLDNLSSDLKDSNSNDYIKYFNADSALLFGADSTINSIPLPMHIQEIEIEDSITLTGTGLSPFLKVFKKSVNEVNSINKKDSETSKPSVLPAALNNERLEDNASESKMTQNTKYTPTKVMENRPKTTRKSLSTPKKPNSYIRALNFDTPINRSQSESKVNNTESCLSPDSLKRSFKNSCKSSLFQSPPFANSEFVEQITNTKVLPTIPESSELVESNTLKKDSTSTKKESVVKPVVTEKKSWDSDLRKYLGKSEDESSSKKRSRSESTRRSHKKAKKDDKNTPKKEKKSYKKSSKRSKKDYKLNDDDEKKEDIKDYKKKEKSKDGEKKEEIKGDKKKEESKDDKKKEEIKADKKKEESKDHKKKEEIKGDKKKEESKDHKKKEEIKDDKKKEDAKIDKRKREIKSDKKKDDIKVDKRKEIEAAKKKEDYKADKRKENIKTDKKEESKPDRKKENIKTDKKMDESKDNKKKEQIIDDKETSHKIKIVNNTIVPTSKESSKKEEAKELKEKNRDSKSKISNEKKRDDVKEREEKKLLELKKRENEKIEQNKLIEEKGMKNEVKVNYNNNKKELENSKETRTENKSRNIDKKDSENSYSINKEKIEPVEPKSNVENAEDKSVTQKSDSLIALLSDSINDDNDEIQNVEKLASEMVILSQLNNETDNDLPNKSNDVNVGEDEMSNILENMSDQLTAKILSEQNAVALGHHTKEVEESSLQKEGSVDYAKVEEELSIITNAEDPKSVSKRAEVIYDEVSKVERGKIVQKKYARLKTLDTKLVLLNDFGFDFEIPDKDEDSLQVPPTPQVLSPGSSSLMLPLSKMSEDSRTLPSLIPTPLECPKTPTIVITPTKGQTEHTSDVPEKTETCYQPSIIDSEPTKKPEITQFEVIKENLIRNARPLMETSAINEDNLSKIQAPMSYRETQNNIPSENNDSSTSVTSYSCNTCCSSMTARSKESEKEVKGDANSDDDDSSDEEQEDEDEDDEEEEEEEDEEEEEEEEEEDEKEINNPGQEFVNTGETSPAKVFSINKTDKELVETVQQTPAKDSSCTEVEIFDTPNVSKPVEQPTNLNTKITQMMIIKDQDNKIIQIRPKPKIISVKRVLPRVITKPPIQLIKALPKNIQLQALEIKKELEIPPPTNHRLKIEKSEEEIALAIKSIENHKFNKSQDEVILLSATPSPANKSIDKSINSKNELAQAIESLTRTESGTIEQFGKDERAFGTDGDGNSDANFQLVLEDNCEKDEENSKSTEHDGNEQDDDCESILNNSHSHNTRFQSQQRQKEKEMKRLSNCAESCQEIRFFFNEETYKKKRRKGFSDKDLCNVIADEEDMCILQPTKIEIILDIKPKRKKPVRKAQAKKEKCLKLDENSHDSMPTQNHDSESIPESSANVANDAATTKKKRPLEEGESSNKQVVKKRKKNIFVY